jgi:hypothetical protein
MSMKADEIEKVVKELLIVKDTLTRDRLDTLFQDFRTKNRMFYELILEGQFDPVIFNEMMKRKRELENGTDQYSVDVKFGRYMAEKYIDPLVKNKKS